MDGLTDGLADGLVDGATLRLGSAVPIIGAFDGDSEGLAEGKGDEGELLGDSDGELLGEADGIAVGLPD